MNPHQVILLGLFLLFSSVRLVSADDVDKIQGTWICVASEREAKPIPDHLIQEASIRLVFKGNQVTAINCMQNSTARGKLTLRSDTAPKSVEILLTEGDENFERSLAAFGVKAVKMRGVYSIDDEQLKLCTTISPGEVAPTDFKTEKGTMAALTILKRIKPKEGAEPIE